jgi:hypothetical protein
MNHEDASNHELMMPRVSEPVEAVAGSAGASTQASRRSSLSQPVHDFLEKHEDMLWWAHSAWALIFGIWVMWLGTKHASVLRLTILYISFIWISSMFLPALSRIPRLSEKWQFRIRLVVNYFNKNFYQQLLFFVIPIYYASCTIGSRNLPFMLLLIASATLSTLDIVYDRYLSIKWYLMTLFLGFNIFACINVILPILWTIPPRWSPLLSILLSVSCFATMAYRFTHLRHQPFWIMVGSASAFMLLMIALGRPFIPPVPLSLASPEFGQNIDRANRKILNPMAELPPGYSGKIYALTPIKAPFGLQEKVRHRWYLDGKMIMKSAPIQVTGGRKDGFRYWTYCSIKPNANVQTIQVDVETEGGQLIGRAKLYLGSGS